MDKFPVKRVDIYPKELLDAFEVGIVTYNNVYENYYDNKEQLKAIEVIFQQVLRIREESLRIPDYNFEHVHSGTTIMSVHLDVIAENLLLKYIRIQQKFINKLYGN